MSLCPGHDIVLTTYSVLTREYDKPRVCSPLRAIEWYRLVLDESHIIKNPNTKQSKFCQELQTTCQPRF